MITYEQQWQKITSAYLKNQIEPYATTFCFCGNLCGKDDKWAMYDNSYGSNGPTSIPVHKDYYGYKAEHFVRMERALLEQIHIQCSTRSLLSPYCPTLSTEIVSNHPLYEEALFKGMEAALEELRKIHLEMGDETANEITLTKRTLQTA